MPQSTYMPLYTASYPILAKAQKPGGVTVLSAVSGGDVPNKHVFVAGTIQLASLDAELSETRVAATEANNEVEVEEEEQEHEVEEVDEEEEDEGESKPHRRSPSRRGKHHK